MTDSKSNSKKGRQHLAHFDLINFKNEVLAFKNQLLFLFLLLFTFSIGHAYTVPKIDKSQLGFSCIEEIMNVALDENCSNVLPLSMLVIGDIGGIDNYLITIDGQETNIVTTCGDLTYTVDLFIGGENIFSCTGTIRAEDNTPPIVVCPPSTNQGNTTANIQTINGVLDGTGSSLNLTNYSCFSNAFNPTDGEHEYDVVTFSVSATDVYTLALETEWDNGLIALFKGDFNPQNPCQNIIGQSDDTNNQGNLLDPTHRLALPLEIDQSYTLLITNFDHESLGGWELIIATDGDAFVVGESISTVETVPITVPLICDDIQFLRIIGQETYVVQADGTLELGTMSQNLHEKLLITGFPASITDNCSDILVTVFDEVFENGDCGDIVLTRVFRATDHYNSDCNMEANTFSCTQVITFRKPTLDDVVLPPFVAAFECDEDFPTDGEIGGEDDNPDPSVAGYPWLLTAFGYQNLAGNYCTVGTSYSDEPRINVCSGTYKFRREWNLIDWCNPGTSFSWDQIVKVGNFTGPVVTIDINNNNGSDDTRINISTSPFGCAANYAVHYANVVTNCGADASNRNDRLVTILTASGDFVWAGRERLLNGQTTVVQGLEIGAYTATWCISDDCGNETCATWDLIVTDEIAATASCNDDLIVSIGGGDVGNGIEGAARFYATDVDQGSYDNCEIDHIEIRRNYYSRGADLTYNTDDDTCDYGNDGEDRWSHGNDGAWGHDYINFFCCDIGNEIIIEMRVYDTNNNFNTCWFTIDVQDRLNPYCFVPEDVTLNCMEMQAVFPNIEIAYEIDPIGIQNLMNDIFGHADGTDNCAVDTIVEIDPLFNLNACGWGSIVRQFEAWQWLPEGDVNGNGAIDREEALVSLNDCTQQITISESHDYQIDFPLDINTDCVEPLDFGLDMQSDGCDVLAVNIGDPQRVEAIADECYMLTVTYDVINWCLWDGEYAGYTVSRENMFSTNQDTPFDGVIDTINRPVLTGNGNGVTLDYTHPLWTRANPYGLIGQGIDVVCFAGGYLCRGRWNYTQFIRVYDSITPIVTVNEFGGATEECPNLVVGQFGDTDGSSDALVSIPFAIFNECTLGLTVLSAEIDLFVVDENGDGTISSNEFMAELGADGDVIANITSNSSGNYLFEGIYPIIPNAMGDNVYHAISVLFEDACGNEVNEIIHFDVVDCLGPTPICINGILVTLMPVDQTLESTDVDGDGDPDYCATAVWASNLEASPIYHYAGQGPEMNGDLLRITKFAIYRVDGIENFENFIPDPMHIGAIFTQDDAEEKLINVYVYAFDENGNYDYCLTYIQIESHLTCDSGLRNDPFGGINEKPVLYNENMAFELYQNMPNPFIGKTLISFTLPTDNEVTITFTDLTGRTIQTIRGNYFAGYNSVEVSSEILGGATGVVNYMVSTATSSATKKMVIMK